MIEKVILNKNRTEAYVVFINKPTITLSAPNWFELRKLIYILYRKDV